jgi:inosine/xanthosine triphosphatase
MIVAVGSGNPAKIESARLAFAELWPQETWDVVGYAVESGVSAQPMSDTESIRGAQLRAARALEASNAEFGVGHEGGLQLIEDRWFNCGWAAVVDASGAEGVGSSIRMEVPTALMDLVLAGQELGHACDEFFGTSNARLAEGFVGLMTAGAIQRTGALRDAVIAALAALRRPELSAG